MLCPYPGSGCSSLSRVVHKEDAGIYCCYLNFHASHLSFQVYAGGHYGPCCQEELGELGQGCMRTCGQGHLAGLGYSQFSFSPPFHWIQCLSSVGIQVSEIVTDYGHWPLPPLLSGLIVQPKPWGLLGNILQDAISNMSLLFFFLFEKQGLYFVCIHMHNISYVRD